MIIKAVKFLALFLFCANAGAVTLIRGPYLDGVSRRQAMIRWETDTVTHAWLTYGPPNNCEQFMTVSPPSTKFREMIYGLPEGSELCYQIYLPYKDQETDIERIYKVAQGSFSIAKPAEETSFNFIAFGESGSGSIEQLELAEQINKLRPDFVVHTGGLTETGLNLQANEQFFFPYDEILRHAPFYIALGKSEYGNGEAKDAVEFLKENYNPFHQMPLTGRPPYYYYVLHANASFFFLDANSLLGIKIPHLITSASYQIRWLDYNLGRARAPWKIVVINAPLYSSSMEKPLTALRETLAPIFEKHNVQIVLQGNQHNYERTTPIRWDKVAEKNGTVYLTIGAGGKPMQEKSPLGEEDEWSAFFSTVPSYTTFSIKGRNMEIKTYDSSNGLIDSAAVKQ